jgi:hypothetical protein
VDALKASSLVNGESVSARARRRFCDDHHIAIGPLAGVSSLPDIMHQPRPAYGPIPAGRHFQADGTSSRRHFQPGRYFQSEIPSVSHELAYFENRAMFRHRPLASSAHGQAPDSSPIKADAVRRLAPDAPPARRRMASMPITGPPRSILLPTIRLPATTAIRMVNILTFTASPRRPSVMSTTPPRT